MRGPLPVLTLLASTVVGSVAAANQAEAWRICQPRAEQAARAGGSYDYNTRYDQALDACMTAYRPSRDVEYVPGLGTTSAAMPIGCFPGASVLYRGTLYCTR